VPASELPDERTAPKGNPYVRQGSDRNQFAYFLENSVFGAGKSFLSKTLVISSKVSWLPTVSRQKQF
jgi:hypothetical protein